MISRKPLSQHVCIAVVAFALASLVPACRVTVSYDDTMYQCPDDVCPAGFVCQNNRCVRPGTGSDADSDAGSIAIDAAPVADASPQPAYDPTVGNVLYLPFNNDYPPIDITLDHGPHGLDAREDGADVGAGRYGQGRNFDDDDDAAEPDPDSLRVPDSTKLFVGNTLTIEAWITPHEMQDQAIISDFNGDDTPNVEYSFELTAAGGLAFYSNAGCTDDNVIATTTTTTIPIDVYTHVAVTWDREQVRFYVYGNLVETVPFAHEACEFAQLRAWRIGRRNNKTHGFDGLIDELKLSDYAKSATEIQQSMNHNSVAAGATCGNRIIENSEQCDGINACCDASGCQFSDDGTICANATCQGGVCQIQGGRIEQGLVALYRFDEGTGDTVHDTAGGDAIDLTISDPTDVTWEASALTIIGPTRVASAGPATKIIDACKNSAEITVETWVRPADTVQDGPARMMTVSEDNGARNFTLGQDQEAYVFRVRSAASDGNGEPLVTTAVGDVRTELTHVVATRRADGERRIYVNGVLRGASRVEGDFAGWDNNWQLGLGNEFVVQRSWLGTFHLVAVYCRNLTGDEVAQNFVAGVD